MYRLKHLVLICFTLFLTGCYESETVIELNPDGSGVITTSTNFDNATEEQRQQVKSLLNQPNTESDFNEDKMNEKFPSPFFEIIELMEDREALHSKSVIKFVDINRLLAVNSQSIQLKGLGFEVQGDELIFKITRSSQQSGFGPNVKFKGTMDKFAKNIYPKETIRIVNAQTNDVITFFHEYKGEEIEKEFTWEGRLKIPDHTIKRELIKYNFANYPVLKQVTGKIKSAAWNRTKQGKNSMAQSNLNLDLSVPFPQSDEFVYLGYDQVYLISGEYNNGTLLEIDKMWQEEFKKFNDENNLAGAGKFKLPLDFAFSKSSVEWMESLNLRVRLLRGKNSKRIEIGKLLSGNTHESIPFKFTITEITNDELSLDVQGPITRLDMFLIKTRNGNVFPLKPSSWPSFNTHGNVRFREFLPLENSALLVDFYDSSEYVWLDVDVPRLDFRQKIEDMATTDRKDLLGNLFPEYKDFPEISESVYKDKVSFENYWGSLNDEQIIPALLVISSNLEMVKANNEVYYWYQADLGKKLKGRTEFYEANKEKITDQLFQLFLEMPDQNSNMTVAYFLSNSGLSGLVREKALKAVQDRKLRNGIDIFFKDELNDMERNVLAKVFENSDYWVESLEVLKLLTKGPKGDLELAQQVLKDEGRSIHMRNYAFEVLLDRKEDISASDLMPYIADPGMRQWVMQTINNRLGDYRSTGQISKERLIAVLKPMISVFEDLAEQNDKYQADIAKKYLEAIQQY